MVVSHGGINCIPKGDITRLLCPIRWLTSLDWGRKVPCWTWCKSPEREGSALPSFADRANKSFIGCPRALEFLDIDSRSVLREVAARTLFLLPCANVALKPTSVRTQTVLRGHFAQTGGACWKSLILDGAV